MSLDELDLLCKSRGWKLALEVVDATGHTVRSWEGASAAFLRVRVLDRDGDVLAGRCQTEPGLESTSDLAGGALEVLRKRGALA